MHRRKIQLIAGTTYSISLPKEWVIKNKLKEKCEVLVYEKNNRNLVITPEFRDEKQLNEISLNVDEYEKTINHVLFAVYYLGIENINLFSKKEISKEVKARIRKALAHMSGTEINYEDKQKIKIKVLLDKAKVDVIQVLYRTSLIIDMSITSILEELDLKEIRINEDEIDRLYHLMTKIISTALIDSNVLGSSKIKNVSLIPSYFLISKKLENIGDNIKHMAEYLAEKKVSLNKEKEVLEFIKKEISRSIKHLMKEKPGIFEKTPDYNQVSSTISKIKDQIISDFLDDSRRYLMDIEEEIVMISFYNKMIREKTL
ncbi:MAG: hypothetical protein KKF46_01885 [Nanoarchaeota archaeon]|nr:hypothetical protein [Nanoarchaeota archaeon]MBU1321083.1 hypothetical protein [Nanoarchaeota archaeon]MBU1598283.1 hypothetical protein [Nanoarchaeota archaeon]MBU2441332.1 hypothetical protein [Nanoarchaeota archaeon]